MAKTPKHHVLQISIEVRMQINWLWTSFPLYYILQCIAAVVSQYKSVSDMISGEQYFTGTILISF